MGGRKVCSFTAPFTHEFCCDKKIFAGDQPYTGLRGFCKDCTMNQISKVCVQLTSVGARPVLVDNISQNFCRLVPSKKLVRNLDKRVPVIVYRDQLGNSVNETAVGPDVKLKFCHVVELDAESTTSALSSAASVVVAKSQSALSSAASANKSSTASSSSIASSSSSGKRESSSNAVVEHLLKKTKGNDESNTSSSVENGPLAKV
jgi:hypothetical protein